jgi:hypothetical protein
VSKVLAKTTLPAANVLDMLKSDPLSASLTKMVDSLRSRAFLCLNNLVQAMAADDLGGPGTTIGKPLSNDGGQPGVDVVITIFSDFRQFSAKKVALFLKTNVMIKICKNYQHFVQKSQFFGGNIFISVPSYAELILILS